METDCFTSFNKQSIILMLINKAVAKVTKPILDKIQQKVKKAITKRTSDKTDNHVLKALFDSTGEVASERVAGFITGQISYVLKNLTGSGDRRNLQQALNDAKQCMISKTKTVVTKYIERQVLTKALVASAGIPVAYAAAASANCVAAAKEIKESCPCAVKTLKEFKPTLKNIQGNLKIIKTTFAQDPIPSDIPDKGQVEYLTDEKKVCVLII